MQKNPYSIYPYLFKGLKYSKIVNSGFSENQTWGALNKARIGFNIAKQNNEIDEREHYAKVIQKLQRELGLKVTDFSNIGLPASEAWKWDNYKNYYSDDEEKDTKNDTHLNYEKTDAEIDYNKYQQKRALQIRNYIEEYSKTILDD
jgi:hypothetical protein